MSDNTKHIYSRSFFDTVRVVLTFFTLIPLVYFLIVYYPSIVWETKCLIHRFSFEQLVQTMYCYKMFVIVPLILVVSIILNKNVKSFVNILLFIYLILNIICWVPDLIRDGIPLKIGSVPDMRVSEVDLGFMNFYGFWADVSIMLFCISHVMINKYPVNILSSLLMLVMNIWRCSGWLYMMLIYGVEKNNIEELFIPVMFSVPMVMYSMIVKKGNPVTDDNSRNNQKTQNKPIKK